jgi:hypothetical protein
MCPATNLLNGIQRHYCYLALGFANIPPISVPDLEI